MFSLKCKDEDAPFGEKVTASLNHVNLSINCTTCHLHYENRAQNQPGDQKNISEFCTARGVNEHIIKRQHTH